jgi:hypothetical protein
MSTSTTRPNEQLFDQIKLTIMTEYFPTELSKSPKGSMKFFVRDGELAISYHQNRISLLDKEEQPEIGGMKRSQLFTLLTLIEGKFTSLAPIEYGTIVITYELLEDGQISGEILVETQINHRRR